MRISIFLATAMVRHVKWSRQAASSRSVIGSRLARWPYLRRWTLIHGFVAGFGFGGFSLFVNTVAAPAMKSPWAGFLPGLVFGLGTMIMLAVIGGLFGASLRWTRDLTEQEIKLIGSRTGGRTLFFGGMLFTAAGIMALSGLDRHLPLSSDYAFIVLFMSVVALPAFVYTLKEVMALRKVSDPRS